MARKTSNRIAIIDYGMGNLSSVAKALAFLDADVFITHSPTALKKTDKLILPGVGAFGDAMQELKSRKLIEPFKEAVLSGKKTLGICLGLQLLFDSSEESPKSKGLALIEGKTIRFKTRKEKVPHMGWNSLTKIKKHPVLKGIKPGDFFYFVHSFYPKPVKSSDQLANCCHGGEDFTAIAGRDNLIATQFHPEKSQTAGLRLLKNFIDW